MQVSDLKKKNVKSTKINGITYFFVEDIKENFRDLKIDTKEIMYKDDVPFIRAKFVHQKTEFDLMIEKTLNKDK